MKVGILCAGDREVAPFIPMIEDCSITEKAMLKFYEGKIANVEVVTLFSGVCKVNASIATQILIDTFGCDIIINAGTAGGMDEKLNIFDTVISREVAYHDVKDSILTDFHPWLSSIFFKADDKLLSIAQKVIIENETENRFVIGRMVTGEQFIEDDSREVINAKYQPQCVDMETASVAHVCYVNKTPFIAVRTLTDNATHTASGDFHTNCPIASSISANFVRSMLQYL